MSKTARDRGQSFLELHEDKAGFVMPNAWDAGSAVLLASEGFEAIGTTSAGIAFSLGKPDYAVSEFCFAVSRDEAIDRLRQIVDAVDIPVNADLESGYGRTPQEVAQTVRMAIDAGAAGANIEDVDRATGRLYDLCLAAERLLAAHEAAIASGRTFVLNARTDAVQCDPARGLDAAIERAQRFIRAGAHCIFVPGVADAVRARHLVQNIGAPVNLVVGLNEAGSSARDLIDAGVRRVSVGGSIARAALGLVRRAARELRDAGTVSYARDQIPQPELNRIFEQAWKDRLNPSLDARA
ncbi:isocitrate lyase/PEP mutase family protein [Piscinibacter terrae]|uniref:Isocitrate lyase/phosphoenolpyruvate mutase family protein n=1 Tax=Piscinibacter terrae TaxID=2496871 RepID=A0A3N7HKI2_9BURK|nr:isocitrate lyase/phosphoenolpyruvate mutase family protein [Albitalea terrae]RQP22600.1 isocitrate lyase/phosphoenolpyruvate mutase family protein [Albitalea terrae]